MAVGRRKSLGIFGNDYNTPDGTGIRDYLHVVSVITLWWLCSDEFYKMSRILACWVRMEWGVYLFVRVCVYCSC